MSGLLGGRLVACAEKAGVGIPNPTICLFESKNTAPRSYTVPASSNRVRHHHHHWPTSRRAVDPVQVVRKTRHQKSEFELQLSHIIRSSNQSPRRPRCMIAGRCRLSDHGANKGKHMQHGVLLVSDDTLLHATIHASSVYSPL